MGNMSGSSGSHYTLRVDAYVLRQGTSAENYSIVRADLWIDFDGSSWNMYTGYTSSGFIDINGNQKTFSISSMSFTPHVASSVYLGTYDVQVNHKDNGECGTVWVSGYWNVNTSKLGEGSVVTSLVPPKIPRYTSITSFSVIQRDETSVSYVWSASNECDFAWCSADNGATWYPLPSNNIFSQLAVNTTYNFKLRVRRKDSQLTTDSGTVRQSTYDYPKVISAPNFTIGNPFTITLYNPLSRSLNIVGIGANGDREIFSAWGYTGNNITGFHDATSVSRQYASIPNSSSGKYKIELYVNDLKRTTTVDGGTYSVDANQTMPTFSDFTYRDTNSVTTALTGNNQILIKGYSNVRGSITVENKATAQNSATMSKYQMTIGEQSKSANYSDTATVNITINNITTNVIDMIAIDSRKVSSPKVTKTITGNNYKEYSNINIKDAIVERSLGGVGTEVTLTFNGYLWNNSFGKVTNTIKSCVCYYKRTNSSTWITGSTITDFTLSGNNFSKSVAIIGDLEGKGFNRDNTYDIKITITDELSSYDYQLILGSGKPLIAKHKNGIAFGDMYDETLGGIAQFNGEIYKNGRNTDYLYTSAGVHSEDFNSYDETERGQAFFRSGMFTTLKKDSPNWYNLINLRHRNGEDDGSRWGMQIRKDLNNFSLPLQIRGQADGNWSDWENLYRAKILYDNASGTAGTIVLNEPAYMFKYIEIIYSHNPTHGYASIKVNEPDNKRGCLSQIEGQQTYIVFYTGTIQINGTAISFTHGNGMSVHETFTLGGFAKVNEIKIFQVIGYR